MRFLADVEVSVSTVKSLRREGHDAVHLREENLHRLLILQFSAKQSMKSGPSSLLISTSVISERDLPIKFE